MSSTQINFTEAMSRLCNKIIPLVQCEESISDDILLNFNKTAIFLMDDIASNDIPTALYTLEYLITDYVRFRFAEDEIKSRTLSYIRLYQIINTLTTFKDEHNLQLQARKAALEESSSDTDVLQVIKYMSDPSYSNLLKYYKNDLLNKHLHALKTKGFIIEGGTTNDKYYVLSRLGDEVFNNLTHKN